MPTDLLQSMLFVPADSARKLENARSLHPDAFIFDLEDAVPADRKGEARRVLQRELESPGHFPAKIFIRVNAGPSGRIESGGFPFLDDDLRVAVSPKVYGIVLPKCDEPSQIRRIHENILALEKQNGMPEGYMKLVLILESARGVAQACALASASGRVTALMFGGEDYCADMAITRTKSGEEITVARSLVALAARSEGVEAIDGVYTDFNDAAGLFEETQRIKQMGFTGKALIHPSQIDVVHRALAPSEEELAWAHEIVGAFKKAKAGVVVVRGRMVDEPIVRQAKRILQQSRRR